MPHHTFTEPIISVCLPVYNAGLYIEECIDSILMQSFEDFELLIGDDGSTDNSIDIIKRYSDPRIRLIEYPHDYIGTLNSLIDESRGKYIARMDADDIMYPERLKEQFTYMESHHQVDVLGGDMTLFHNRDDIGGNQTGILEGKVTLSDLINGCCIYHPTTIIRKSALEHPVRMRYDSTMVYAEDYDLWTRLVAAGKVIHNTRDVAVRYRIHSTQVSSLHSIEQAEKTDLIRSRSIQKLSEIAQEMQDRHKGNSTNDKKLTIIIPFLNEKEEVANTIHSIYDTVGCPIEIIVINDDSNDEYDYDRDIEELNVTYIKNPHRLGAAISKELGVQLSNTPYFLLLDAHMRFYRKDWGKYLIDELERNNSRLLCCRSIPLHKDDDGNITISDNNVYSNGAYIYVDSMKYVPYIEWNNHDITACSGETKQIPCVLGAGYATSKAYWNRIKGLQGLMHYGCEEAYISIKAWKEGGGCHILSNLLIGHIYRQIFPYKIHSPQVYYNNLLISELLFPTSERMLARSIAWNIDKSMFNTIMKMMDANRMRNEELRRYYDTLSNYSFQSIKDMNNKYYNINHNGNYISDKELATAVQYLKDNVSNLHHCGLYTGITGALIACVLYAERGHDGIIDTVCSLWNRIKELAEDRIGVMFQNGLTGIGWALIYLRSHNLIEDDIEEELSYIDDAVAIISVKRMKDTSFKTGLGGIYCYVVARLAYNIRYKNGECPFEDDFMTEMRMQCQSIIDMTTDWRTINFVSQFMEYGRPNWQIMCPEFIEIIDLPCSIPKSEAAWELNLNGITGAIINKLTH
ncbi:MAG: glycosyltransferase [Prevotellaceae bacterium]|nr:glycosyltransferase [Prevotellaceae bacterium]